jgi:16S rRNA (guanine966-N2)-methyltransferase
MRIIAGQRRGHKIEGPRARARTRPTSDLVRESVFNILGEVIVDRDVVDLFAGAGAIGLEALSRGARRAVFVERNRENVGLIHRNVATLRYEDRASVRHADAYRWARALAPETDRPLIVFLDPPYREYEIHARFLQRMLSDLIARLPVGSVLVLEAGRILDGRILPEFERWDTRRYGNTQVAIRVLDAVVEEAGAPAGSGAQESDDVAPGGLAKEERSDD